MNKVTIIKALFALSFFWGGVRHGMLLHAQSNFGSEDDFFQWHQQFLGRGSNYLHAEEEGSDLNRHSRTITFWRPRLYPSGDINLAGRAMADYRNWAMGMQRDGQRESNWTPLGPFDTPAGPHSARGTGQIHCIAFHPDYETNNTLFVGSAFGGLFKSTNRGASWTPMTDFLVPISSVTDIAIHPTNGDIMYIATGNVDSDKAFSAGVYRTINGGASWTPMNDGLFNSRTISWV